MVRIEPRAFRLLHLCALGALLHLGCTLITDVDRTKIPQPPPFETEDAGEVPPEPETDAGVEEADAAPEPEDAGGVEPIGDASPGADAGA